MFWAIGGVYGIYFPLGSTGVFIFLFLSGYGIASSLHTKGRKGYFPKRISKVWIPYAITVICFVIFSILMGERISVVMIGEYLSLLRLPVGIYWYLRLNFYWYIVIYIMFVYCNTKVRFFVVSILASIIILILTGFDRKYIWQIATFPLGVIAFTYRELAIEGFRKICSMRGRILNLIVIVTAFCIKKTPFVEAHELGLIDTLLQIIISAATGIFIMSFKDVFKSSMAASVLILIGGVSYELYLCHAVAYDYVAEHTISFGVYLIVAFIVFCCLRLYDFCLTSSSKSPASNEKR